VPEQPSSPNRKAILLLGLVLSISGGLGSASVLESLDHSVRGSRALAGLVPVPVLAVIPYVENIADRQRKRRVAWVVIASSVAVLGLAAVLVHFFYVPLDVLWFRALRSLGVYVPAVASIPVSPSGMMRIVWNA